MYKKKIIEKVLNHDLQSNNFNAAKFIIKPCVNKNGKKLSAKGVAIKGCSGSVPGKLL